MAHNSRTILFFFSYWLACAATVGRGGGGVIDPRPRGGDAGSAVARPCHRGSHGKTVSGAAAMMMMMMCGEDDGVTPHVPTVSNVTAAAIIVGGFAAETGDLDAGEKAITAPMYCYYYYYHSMAVTVDKAAIG